MAVSEKRKDNRGRILRDGEQQRADGRYMYTYRDRSFVRLMMFPVWAEAKFPPNPQTAKVPIKPPIQVIL